MADEVELTCPHCGKPVAYHAQTGELLKKEKNSGDRFDEAFKKVTEGKSRRKELFDQSKGNLSKKKKESDELFKKGLEDIKEKGLGDKPVRDIDL